MDRAPAHAPAATNDKQKQFGNARAGDSSHTIPDDLSIPDFLKVSK
jgi:hypothetical protein